MQISKIIKGKLTSNLVTLLLLYFSFLVSACSSPVATITNNIDSKDAYDVVDDTGCKIHFAKKPQRIISLTYGTDDILVDLVDLKRIIAFSYLAGDENISFVTKKQTMLVGRKVNDNLEYILSLQPDLVVASVATNSNVVVNIKNCGIPVYIAQSPHNYQEMRNKVINLAIAVGEKEKGNALVNDMDAELAKLEERLSKLPDEKRKVAVAYSFTAPMGQRGNLFDNMLGMAHVINGAARVTPVEVSHGTVVINKETVIDINPDVFLLPTWNYNKQYDVKEYANSFRNDVAYQSVKAVKNNQLLFVPDKYRYVASHHIVEAVEKLAQTVYPELF